MAQSLSFFGNRRGSTKSHTYQVNGGMQITKDRVDEVKNPRTTGQMVHRCCLHTLSDAHAYLRPFIAPLWPSFPSPAKQLAEFRKANYPIVHEAAESGDRYFSFSPYKELSYPIGLFQFSEPIISNIDYRVLISIGNDGYYELGVRLSSNDFPNVKDFCNNQGLEIGDELVLTAVFRPSWAQKAFVVQAIFRIKNIPNENWQDVDFASVFTVKQQTNVPIIAIEKKGGRYCSVRWLYTPMPGSILYRFDFFYAIKYRPNSKGVFSRLVRYTSGSFVSPTFAEAIATYPQGGGNVLDGGTI